MNTSPSSTQLADVQALIAAGRIREADRACQTILSREPRNVDARFFFALTRFHLSRYDDTLTQLQTVLGANPAMTSARYLLAEALRVKERFSEAAAAYGEALARDFGLRPTADPGSRLQSILEFIALEPIKRWASHRRMFEAFGMTLEKSGFQLDDARLLASLGASPLARAPWAEFPDRFAAARELLAVSADSSRPWMDQVFRGVLLPWMRAALAADRFDSAYEIENAIYTNKVRQTETQEHFRECFSLWLDDMRAAGRRFAATLPAVARGAHGARPRIAFFVHNVTMLAHVVTLLEVLRGHAELAEPLMEPFLFFRSGKADAVEQFRQIGVRTESLIRDPSDGMSVSLLRLRQRIAEEDIEVLAWISLAVAMPFAFSMRVAPRQVWWAMKYHALEFPEIDDYMTGGGDVGVATLQGRSWRVGPVVAGEWFSPELGDEAKRVRASLGPAGVVFGTFGREEKIDSPAFLDAVAEILRACPDARFLWTGRTQSVRVQERLESAGVAARCHFIGWVDTKLYAQVIDVFLDSFPFPCGYTLYEAMAAGKPAVLFASPESSHGGINAIVGPLLASDPQSSDEARLAQSLFRPDDATRLYLRATTPGEYKDHAIALARDPDFRARAGAAHRDFIDKLMTDRRRAARIYVDHLLGRDVSQGALAT